MFVFLPSCPTHRSLHGNLPLMTSSHVQCSSLPALHSPLKASRKVPGYTPYLLKIVWPQQTYTPGEIAAVFPIQWRWASNPIPKPKPKPNPKRRYRQWVSLACMQCPALLQGSCLMTFPPILQILFYGEWYWVEDSWMSSADFGKWFTFNHLDGSLHVLEPLPIPILCISICICIHLCI